MLNQLPRTFTRLCVVSVFIGALSVTALAQTPSPTPVNPATLPPGQQTVPPTAPPGTPVVTPGTPAVTPGAQPTPITPAIQEPNFPTVQAMPVPPLPDLTRVGVQASNVVPLSLNDAIRKALQNNNDIEVARDDVRFAEQQLKSLYGVYDPIFAITPQFIHNIAPQQPIRRHVSSPTLFQLFRKDSIDTARTGKQSGRKAQRVLPQLRP